jgi:formylmethanofuran dehydrogenase subunit C
MKPAEVKKLADAENKLLKALAEIGDLTMQMEQARQRQLALAGEVQRMRQDFQAMMRGTVIAHGFDPDADKFNLNIESGQIERIG